MRRLTLLLLASFASACDRPTMQIRKVVKPPQRTIAELLVRYDTATFPPCGFSDATSPSTQAIVSRDGGLRLVLSGAWTPRDVDARLVDSTTSQWHRTGGGGVEISRKLNGASSPSWIETPSYPTVARPTCLVAQVNAGTIWRLYDPGDPQGTGAGKPYDGLAEVITPDSLRYDIMLSAPTAALRDSLAAQATRSILHPSGE